MRAVQIALLVICLQIGIGLIAESGLFTKTYFESSITNVNVPSEVSALNTDEQVQESYNIMTDLWNILSWGWIKTFFEPLYSQDEATKKFVDHILLFLRSITSFVIGVAFIEFVRNRLNVLGSG